MYQLIKNLLNLIKKQEEKPGDSIDKKLLKLDKEIKKKADYLLLCKHLFYKR